MKKQLVIIGIVVLLVSIGLSGCILSSPKKPNRLYIKQPHDNYMRADVFCWVNQPIRQFNMSIKYDPSKLEFLSIFPGESLWGKFHTDCIVDRINGTITNMS